MRDSNNQKDYIEINKLLDDFVAWLKKPDPDTTLLKLWKKKRARDKIIQSIQDKQKAEQYRESIEKEAYFLWEADGKQEDKNDYYWKLATEKIKGKNIPTIYKPYYLLEKHVLEPTDAWIDKQAFFTILGRLGNLAFVVAVVSFIFGENVRRNNEVFTAWQTITGAEGQSGSGGRIEALEFLNSRPLRFPWVGWTEKGLYWDEQEKKCKEKRLFGRRWKQQPLIGLSAPNKAYLEYIHLCKADLGGANLQEARLGGANLQEADLGGANLQGANLFMVNFQEALLGGANLQKVYLFRAKLQKANLFRAKLQKANLSESNFQEALLYGANLQKAYLFRANLQEALLWGATNLTPKQIKSACYWKQAIHKGEWNREKNIWEITEPDNTNFIEKLKKDKSSDPKEKPDCSIWSR